MSGTVSPQAADRRAQLSKKHKPVTMKIRLEDDFHKSFFIEALKKIKKRQQKQAHQHDTFKLKMHWQLQVNDHACTPSFEHIRQTPKSKKSTIKSKFQRKGIFKILKKIANQGLKRIATTT